MKEINLKIFSEYFDAIVKGLKTFEVRWNDRGYAVGDVLRLREHNEGGYSGRECRVKVTYYFQDEKYLQPGYCILGIAYIVEEHGG